MTKKRTSPPAGRRIVELRKLDDFEPLTWALAKKLDPDRTSWGDVLHVVDHSDGTCNVMLAVDESEFLRLTAGCRGKRAIEESIAAAFYEVGREVAEDDALSLAVASLPVCSDVSVFGPHSVVVEWGIHPASHVAHWIGASVHDVGCIELVRLGRIGRKSVTLAVSLPIGIFDAAMAKIGTGAERRPLANCVYEAIAEAALREPRSQADIDADSIPF